ncbi:unnamed protein product [Triticum turgidum subsp. durum]|uniref:DUF7876 domain-containing protein n=1 Tax=Triticum turgidum subsp. durum TaxID=4567 RepID=A0A9R0XHI0_TRITD|nr:unnamed protein product [Triticum turgidum subsp. durum]
MPMLHGPILFVRPGAYQELKPFPKNTAGSCSNLLGCNTICSSVEDHHVQKPHIVSSLRVNFTRVSHYLQRSLNERTTRHWLHRFHVNASSDEDFRSSRNIATSLFKQYKNVIDRGGGDNIKGFVSAGVQAYALGCTEEGLRKELMDIKNSGVKIEGLQSFGGTSLSFKVRSFEYSVHYNPMHATADGHQVVYHPTGVGGRLASVERILCPDSKRLLHQGHGMATSENIAAGTDGCDRQFGGAIASSKSDAVSFQYVRGSQPPMAKSVIEGRASNMIIQRPASLQNPCHIQSQGRIFFL